MWRGTNHLLQKECIGSERGETNSFFLGGGLLGVCVAIHGLSRATASGGSSGFCVASSAADHGLQGCGLSSRGTQASAAAEHGFSTLRHVEFSQTRDQTCVP